MQEIKIFTLGMNSRTNKTHSIHTEHRTIYHIERQNEEIFIYLFSPETLFIIHDAHG